MGVNEVEWSLGHIKNVADGFLFQFFFFRCLFFLFVSLLRKVEWKGGEDGEEKVEREEAVAT